MLASDTRVRYQTYLGMLTILGALKLGGIRSEGARTTGNDWSWESFGMCCTVQPQIPGYIRRKIHCSCQLHYVIIKIIENKSTKG